MEVDDGNGRWKWTMEVDDRNGLMISIKEEVGECLKVLGRHGTKSGSQELFDPPGRVSKRRSCR